MTVLSDIETTAKNQKITNLQLAENIPPTGRGKNVKLALEQATNAQRGSLDVDLLYL